MSSECRDVVTLIVFVMLLLSACASDDDQSEGWRQRVAAPFGADGSPLIRGGSQSVLAGRNQETPRAMLYPGSDQFLGTTGAPFPSGAIKSGNGVLLNFEDAELRQVVDVILGETFGLNYFFDPRVQGRVTLQTASPLEQRDAVAALHLVIQQNGGALVERGEIMAVVPAAEAGASALSPILASSQVTLPQGNAVLIASLQSASASELADLIEPLSGNQTTVRFDKNRNVLIIAGPSTDLAALRETISVFDVDWLNGLSYGLFPLGNANPNELIEELQAVLGGENSPIRDQVVLQPIVRMNAVLAVTKRRKVLEEIRLWVGRLDRDLGSGRDGVFVYRAENVPAEELANALTSVFGTNDGISSNTGAVFARGTPTATVATSEALQTTDSRSSVLRIGNTGEEVRVFANASNNTLIVRAKPGTYRRMASLIRQLDVAPPQVLIEATIVEVALTEQLNYGVQFFLENNSRSIVNSAGSSNSIAGAFPGFVASYVSGGSEVILSALDSVTQINIVSNPRLMVLDNRSARLNVGDDVPILTQQQQDTSSNSNIINQVDFRQTGLVLDVTPRISASGLVTLDIVQETSNVVQDASSGTLTPTISQRSLESSISVQNGQTILLGGLVESNDQRGKTGTPILSDVPVLGNLFGTRRNGSSRTEIIILLTPRVIRDPNEVRSITEELRRRVADLPPSMTPKNSLIHNRK